MAGELLEEGIPLPQVILFSKCCFSHDWPGHFCFKLAVSANLISQTRHDLSQGTRGATMAMLPSLYGFMEQNPFLRTLQEMVFPMVFPKNPDLWKGSGKVLT